MLPFKTILHPTDFSDTSAPALTMAVDLACDYRARLILLHAVEPPVYAGELGLDAFPSHDDRLVAERRLAALATGPAARADVESLVTEGIAPREIVRVARERRCDLVVVSSHGRSGIGRVLMGSIAEEVARHSPCPVLIVRTPHAVGAGEALPAAPR
jgi:nucleotide-binding universal stress UspA family protein